MKTLMATFAALLMLVGTLSANEEALDATRSHLSSFLHADYEKMGDSYASKVTLMPGHEFLKTEYGLTTEPGRRKAVEVERETLIRAMTKATEGQPDRPAEKIAGIFESLRFEVVAAPAGDFAATPPDPVGTPDSMLHFKIVEGDVLVKVSPPRGDFILLQLRHIDGAWRVIAEYLD